MNDERAGGSRPASDQEYTPGDLARLPTIGLAGAPDPEQLIAAAVRAVPHAEHAGLTLVGEDDRLQVLAFSDDVVAGLDAVQLEVGDGPDLDSHSTALVHVADLAQSSHWAAFGPRALELGLCSAARVRLEVPRVGRATLTFYASAPAVFTDHDLDVAMVFGSFVRLALENAQQRVRMANLEVALETNRQIGTSIGILMARELLTPDQAFSRLRNASQHLHRKLREVADEVVRTGELPPFT